MEVIMEMTKGYYYDYRRVKPSSVKPIGEALWHDVSRLLSFAFGYKPKNEKRDIVLDASIMQIEGIFDRIDQAILKGHRIIILDTTREELDKLQKFKKEDLSKKNARRLLRIMQNNDNFLNTAERWLFRDPDNRIFQWCYCNKGNVILWTADKRLAAEVDSSGCQVEFFEPDYSESCSEDVCDSCFDNLPISSSEEKKSRRGKFYQSKMIGRDLTIYNNRLDREIWVWRGKDCIKNPENGFKLNLNDQILVAIGKTNHDDKRDYVAFGSYTVVDISDENNVLINYTHRYYDLAEPRTTISNQKYRQFVLTFISEHYNSFPEKIEEAEKMEIIKRSD